MNEPSSEPILSLEDALEMESNSHDRSCFRSSCSDPMCRMYPRSSRFREDSHERFGSGLKIEYRIRSGVPAASKGTWTRAGGWLRQPDSGRSHTRKACETTVWGDRTGPSLKLVMTDVTEAGNSRIERITSHVGVAWDDCPDHIHLMATERFRMNSSADRFAGESAATTTGDAHSYGYLSVVKGP
jgi:hypothetical protein